MKLEGKGVVITGAGSGIGKAVAIEFVRHGSQVVIADINVKALVNLVLKWEIKINNLPQRGEEVVEYITSQYGENKAIFIECDVGQPVDIENAINLSKSQFGTFDIICNNVSIFLPLLFQFL